MKHIDFKKYKRFFAFGCSFTQYFWPTWADIISKEIKESYNYGCSGAGNFFIFQSLIEAIIKHNINEHDLVMIMFSNVTREDRFTKKRGWITPGNLYFQNEYNEHFLEKYLCDHGYLMRDLNLVAGSKFALDNVGCDYKFMSMVPFDSKQSDNFKMSEIEYLLKFYDDILTTVAPSVFDTIFNGNWNSRQPRPKYDVSWQKEKYSDNHPTPKEHLEYLLTVFPDIKLTEETLFYVENNNDIVMSEDFKCNTYKKNSTPRLGLNYTSRDYMWDPSNYGIKKI